MAKSSGDILNLVEQALDEFDQVPAATSCRRAVRIANLLGESQTALRFFYEVKLGGGSREANAEDTRQLMLEPELWADEQGPAVLALNEFMADRALGDGTGKMAAHSLDEIDYLIALPEMPELDKIKFRAFRSTARGRIFARLCAWERQLGSSAVRESALASHERRVDSVLEKTAPEVLTQFNAVFRRLKEAADAQLSLSATEELAQAVSTCRRILKAVVDRVQPVDPERLVSDSGQALNDATYKNRLFEFLKGATPSATHGAALTTASASLWERFDATDALASKGVHAEVARDEAELCALNTYLVAGEVLRAWTQHRLAAGASADAVNFTAHVQEAGTATKG